MTYNVLKSKLVLIFAFVFVFSLGYYSGLKSDFSYDSVSRTKQSQSLITPPSIIPVTIVPITGESVWRSVNNYRVSKNLQPLELDERICNNIVERWRVVESQRNSLDPHAGYDRLDRLFQSQGLSVGELVNSGNNPDEVVSGWSTSPSHKIWLESEKTKIGCAYAYNDYSLLLSGYQN